MKKGYIFFFVCVFTSIFANTYSSVALPTVRLPETDVWIERIKTAVGVDFLINTKLTEWLAKREDKDIEVQSIIVAVDAALTVLFGESGKKAIKLKSKVLRAILQDYPKVLSVLEDQKVLLSLQGQVPTVTGIEESAVEPTHS